MLRRLVLLGLAYRLGKFGVKFLVSKLTLMDIVEEIEVIIKEVYK